MTAFRDLHRSGLLILPNAWDGGSAALMRSLGAKAIATTSAGVAWALGWPDGDALPPARLMGVVADVARGAGPLPVSVDMEGGYSDDPAAVGELAAAVASAGAAGINLEDGGGSPELLAAKIRAVRAAAGPELFINARCDVWLRGLDGGLDEAVRRAALYAEAGADGFFAPGLRNAETIRALVAAIGLPLNLLALPGLPEAKVLEGLGVRRLSSGSALPEAAYGRVAALAAAFLERGESDPLAEGAMAYGALNRMVTG